MKTYFSIGDLVDSYYRFKRNGIQFFLSRIGISSGKRTKAAWNGVIERTDVSWWEIPAIRKRWNFLQTGNSGKNWKEYLFEKYFAGVSELVVLSPGCGTGEKEILLAQFSQIKIVDAFDIAESRINNAKVNAKKKSVEKVNFFVADISSFDFGKGKYDLIIFDSFLHHVKDLRGVLLKAKEALKNNGLLVVDEYVGQNRFQWKDEQLNLANKLLKALPEEMKKRTNGIVKNKIYRPGIIRMIISDPSEAINSASIREELGKEFLPVETHNYGGNILQLLLKDIEHNFLDDSEKTQKILNSIFEAEDEFIRNEKSDFLFGIYKAK